MYAVTDTRAIGEALKAIKRGVSDKATLPILQNVHIAASRGSGATDSITLSVTNLSVAMQATIPASVRIEGEFTVPAHTLREWIELGSPDTELTLARAIDDAGCYRRAIVATCNDPMPDGTIVRNRATVRGMLASDFPVIPNASHAALVGIVRAGELARILSETLPYIERKGYREAMASVYLSTRGIDGEPHGYLTAMASDGARAAMAHAAIDETDASPDCASEFLIPGDAARDILPLLKDCAPDDAVRIGLSDKRNQIILSLASVSIVARLASGDYPASAVYDAMYADTPIGIELGRVAFNKAIKRALALSEDGRRDTYVEFGIGRENGEYGEHTLTIQCGDATDSVPCNVYGEPRTMPRARYNVAFIGEGARGYHSKSVSLYFAPESVKFTCGSDAKFIEGDRVIMRAYSPIEAKRREYRTPGATCQWSPVAEGAHTRILYTWQGATITPEGYRDLCASHATAYAARLAELDDVMCDAWEGYREPRAQWQEGENTECARALARALECYSQYTPRGDALDDTARAVWNARVMIPVITPENGSGREIQASGARRAMWINHDDGSLELNPEFIAEYRAWQDDAPRRDAKYAAYVAGRDARRAALCEARRVAPVALLAAHSIVRKASVPYGLPIPENASPDDARDLWRAYCDMRGMATRVYERDNSRRYRYGERLTILHELAFTWEDGAYAPEVIELYCDASPRLSRAYPTLSAAYAAMLAMIPGRAAMPPGYIGIVTPDASHAASMPACEATPDTSMFDTARLPSYAPVARGEPSPRTMFTLSDPAWRAHAANMATIAAHMAGDAVIHRYTARDGTKWQVSV